MGNLVLNGSTSGSITITPPAVAGTNTLTIPAATGTVLVPTSSGSTGQVLTTNGTTSSWVNGWTLINTTTVTGGAAIQDTTSLTSTYANYMIYIRNLLPATNAVTVLLQIQSGGSYQTTGYSGYSQVFNAASSATTTGIIFGVASRFGNVNQANCVFYINNPSSTTVYKPISGVGALYDTANSSYTNFQSGGAFTTNTNAITGFQISASSGNITGTVQVYGSN